MLLKIMLTFLVLGLFYLIFVVIFDVCSYWNYKEEKKELFFRKVILSYKNFKDFYSLAPYYYHISNNSMPFYHSYIQFDDMQHRYHIFFENYLQTLMALIFVYLDKKEDNKKLAEKSFALDTKEYLQVVQKHIDDTLKKAERETAKALEINKQVKDNLTQKKEYIYYR